MFVEAIDGFLPTLRKRQTLNGYAARSRDGIRFMDLGRCVIRYRVAGRGKEVIVFETDPPVMIEHYDALVDLLSQEFTVVIFEPPGFGFSVPSLRLDYRFNAVVGLTAEFLDKLQLGPVTLVAPCVLGYVGLAVAHQHPELVHHLVLPQVPSWSEMLKWKQRRDPRGLLSKPVISQLLLQALKRKRTPAWFAMALGNPALVEPFNELAQQGYAHGASFNLATGFQRLLIGESPLPPLAENIQLARRTLFLWGERDHSHCSTCKDSSLHMMPHAHQVRLAEAGHFPELEASSVFVEHLLNHLHPETARTGP